MSTRERKIEIVPAYDRRSEGGGQHGVQMRFVLKGAEGAVQFLLFTGWGKRIIASPTDKWDSRSITINCDWSWPPIPVDLGYHSYVPLYKGQTPMGHCPLLGTNCCYDGSSLNAERIFAVLVHEGGDAMWRELEKYYQETFGKLETA